jgi:TM2 domain-containing membrane protein YozV
MSIVPASRKVPAGILGLLLGQFGIHKFYLGMNRAGATMLLLTLAGWVLGHILGIFGYLAGAMAVIGFVEGIIYLCKSDSDFYNTYIVRRQEWF